MMVGPLLGNEEPIESGLGEREAVVVPGRGSGLDSDDFGRTQQLFARQQVDLRKAPLG